MIFVPTSDLGDSLSSWEVSGPRAHGLHCKDGETEAQRGSGADLGMTLGQQGLGQVPRVMKRLLRWGSSGQVLVEKFRSGLRGCRTSS